MKKSIKALVLMLAMTLVASVAPVYAAEELPDYEANIMTDAQLDAFFASTEINTNWGDEQLSMAVSKLYDKLKANGDTDVISGITYIATESYSEATEKPYADYFADFELSTKEDVAIILAGNYGSYNTIPVGIVNLKAGETVRVMEKAAELFNAPGLKFTYKDVVLLVGEFSCTAIPVTSEVLEAFYPIMKDMNVDFANAYPEYNEDAKATMLDYLQNNACLVGYENPLPVVEGTPGLTLGLNLYETAENEAGDLEETGIVYEVTENIFVPYKATVLENPTFIADESNYNYGGEVVADLYAALKAAGNEEIVYAMNFEAVETYDEAVAAPYAKYIADFELASSKDASVLLVGNYDAWKDKTIGTVPIGIINLTADQPTRILKTASDNVAQAAEWTFNYTEICELVKNFDCAAIPLSKELLEAYYAVKCEDATYAAANPKYDATVEAALLEDLLANANPLNADSFKVADEDLTLSLNLNLYENDKNGAKYDETGKVWVVGDTYTFDYVAPEIEEEQPEIMQKMLVVYNMEVKEREGKEYYPVHVYSGIDSLKYNEVGYKMVVTNMEKNESKEKTESTNVVYRNMKVTQTDGTVKNYDAKEALGGTYMFGHEMLFTKGTWTNANTKISVTPYAKKLDGNYVWGKEVVLTDAAVKAKDKNSALFREEKN